MITSLSESAILEQTTVDNKKKWKIKAKWDKKELWKKSKKNEALYLTLDKFDWYIQPEHINGLVRDYSISIINALEIPPFCT